MLFAFGLITYLSFLSILKANEIGTTGQVSVIGYFLPLFGVVGGAKCTCVSTGLQGVVMGSARSHHTGTIPRARTRGFPGAEPSRKSVVLRKASLGKLG